MTIQNACFHSSVIIRECLPAKLHRSSRHFVHQHSMLRAEDIRQQLAAHLRRLGLGAAADSSSEGDLTPALRAITSGG